MGIKSASQKQELVKTGTPPVKTKACKKSSKTSAPCCLLEDKASVPEKEASVTKGSSKETENTVLTKLKTQSPETLSLERSVQQTQNTGSRQIDLPMCFWLSCLALLLTS